MLPGDPRSAAPRAVRAGAFAGVSVALAVGAHAVGGMPLGADEAVVAAVSAVVLGRVAHAAAEREVGLGRLLLGMGVTQVVLHLALQLSSTPAHHHMGLGVSRPMLLGHAVAAGLAALWLRRGERAAWALARLAGAAALRLVPAAAPRVEMPARRVPVRVALPRPRGRELVSLGLARRGPPACA